jgi:hypothetical protein
MPTVLGSTKRRGRGDVDVLELELVLEPVKRNVWLFKLIDSTEADSCGLDG